MCSIPSACQWSKRSSKAFLDRKAQPFVVYECVFCIAMPSIFLCLLHPLAAEELLSWDPLKVESFQASTYRPIGRGTVHVVQMRRLVQPKQCSSTCMCSNRPASSAEQKPCGGLEDQHRRCTFPHYSVAELFWAGLRALTLHVHRAWPLNMINCDSLGWDQ